MLKILILQLLTTSTLFAATPEIKRFTPIKEGHQQVEPITIKLTLDKGEALFQNSISFSVNSPDIQVSSWSIEQTPRPFFDSISKETKSAYQGMVTFKIKLNRNMSESASEKTSSAPINLFMHYMTNKDKAAQEHRFTLSQKSPTDTSSNVVTEQPLPQDAATSQELPITTTQRSFSHLLYDFFHRILASFSSSILKIKQFASDLFTHTESRSIQFLLAFILGILMSLTPCIYPMIPITVGLLGTGTHNTFARNFALALSYTIGLATTFALIGLLATTFGTQSGQILSNPVFVVILVCILAYLGFSMLGWYEMRIPRFLQPRTQTVQKGSYVSAFLFGMGSGTIASPCMSPGLALVLTAVNNIASTLGAGIASSLLGFSLLFVFGLGASLPLLLIGTFSASLHVLPRAGMWMVEIKKIFGFMLLGMCFYYLKNILPAVMSLSFTAFFFLLVGGYYLNMMVHARTLFGKLLTFVISFALITIGIYTFYNGYKEVTTSCSREAALTAWRTDYTQAREEAVAQNKKLLLDFGASWCSLCTIIEKDILHASDFSATLQKVVAVKIDGSKAGAEPYTSLMKEFKILGLPTILLVDPTTNTIIKKWGSELIDKPRGFLAQEIAASLSQSRS
jgi:thiol:disulfide interchange protein